MRNFKRVLALMLAAIMILSMTVVASAATTFTDAEKIKHSDAANLLSDLGIAKGYSDGSYKPEKTVTRAEMAAFICRMLLGEGYETITNTGVTTKFKDVASNHWAAGVINYCYANLGIINGYPDGTFKPDNTVNTVEAATMLLKVLGYNKENEFAKDWSATVMRTAQEAGLLADVNLAAKTGLARDSAGQMIYNAMMNCQTKSHTIALGYLNNGTIAERVWGLTTVEGVITGVGDKCIYIDGKKYDGITTDFTNVGLTASFFVKCKTTSSAGLIGNNVTVDKDNVLKVYSSEVTLKDTKLGTLTDGTSLSALTTRNSGKYVASLGRTVNYYLNGEAVNASAVENPAKGDTVNLIDSNGDHYIDVVSVFSYTAGKVGYLSSTSKTITIGARSFDIENVVGASDLSKGDVAYYYENGGMIYAYRAIKATGKVTNYKSATDTYTIGGKDYAVSARNISVALTLGSSYNVWTDGNGYLLYSEQATSEANYLYGIDNNTYNVQTKLTAATICDTKGVTKNVTLTSIGTGTNSYRITAGEIRGNIYFYEIDKNGNYALYEAGSSDNWTAFNNGQISHDELTATFGLNTVLIDNSTLFIDIQAGKTYIGYANVPSMTSVSGWYQVDRKGIATTVFIGERESDLSNNAMLFFSMDYSRSYATSGYTYDVIVNGVKKSVTVDASVHATIQATGVGMYTATSTVNDVVNGVTFSSFASEWERVDIDRAGLIETTAQTLRKNNDAANGTKYVVVKVNAKTATVCDNYDQAAALVSNDTLEDQMVVMTADASGNYAATVYVITDYSVSATTMSFDSDTKYFSKNGVIYGQANQTVVMTVNAMPGTEITFAPAAGAAATTKIADANGVAKFDVTVADSLSAELTIVTKLGSKTETKKATLNYQVVNALTVSGNLAENTVVSGEDVIMNDNAAYVKNNGSAKLTITVEGTYTGTTGSEVFTPATFTVDADTITVAAATAGMTLTMDGGNFTATYVVERTNIQAATEVAIAK